MTSLAFILLWVPLPVWKTTSGKWSSHVPAATSSAAWQIACIQGAGSLPRR